MKRLQDHSGTDTLGFQVAKLLDLEEVKKE